MQWTDEGIVLGSKRHGEGNAILELMTRAHGRHLGPRAGRRERAAAPGAAGGQYRSAAPWRARLDEHLGHYVVEASMRARPHFYPSRTRFTARRISPRSAGCCPSAIRIRRFMPRSRTCSTGLLDPRRAAPGMVRFELRLLAELGFGLDLSVCAASGVETDLVYVSPNRDVRYRGRRARHGRTSCWSCPHFCARRAPVILRLRTSPTALS